VGAQAVGGTISCGICVRAVRIVGATAVLQVGTSAGVHLVPTRPQNAESPTRDGAVLFVRDGAAIATAARTSDDATWTTAVTVWLGVGQSALIAMWATNVYYGVVSVAVRAVVTIGGSILGQVLPRVYEVVPYHIVSTAWWQASQQIRRGGSWPVWWMAGVGGGSRTC